MRAAAGQCRSHLAVVWCVCAAFLAVAAASAQTALYVDADAAAGGDGASWVSAYRDLQDALAAGAPPVEIRAAGGVYRPDGGSGDRTASFVIPDGVRILGGFAGVDAADPNLRAPEVYETVLSGAIGEIDSRADNSYQVVTLVGVSASTVLDGLTIADGNANGNSPCDTGGAAFINGGGPQFRNVTFRNNRGVTGGAVFLQGGASARFEQCLFVDNDAVDNGGAAFIFTGGPVFDGCVFQRNAVDVKGGAMAALFADYVLADCRFEDNLASNRGGALSTAGGAPTLSGCEFESNTVANQGGSEASGGGLAVDSGIVTATQCTFEGNFALGEGGGAAVLGGTATLQQCALVGNISLDRGGGVAVSGGALLLCSSAIIGGDSFGDGGAIYQNGGAIDLIGSTVTANASGGSGGGVYVANGTANFSSTILWANADDAGGGEAGQIGFGSAAPAVNHCCIAGLTGGLGGVGNIGAAPSFVDAVGADNVAGTGDDDLRLRHGSPCVDAGDPAFGDGDECDADAAGDLGGAARVICGVVDIGAYETPPPLGDLNCDRVVTCADVALWLPCFNGPGLEAGAGCGAADLDFDGDVDLADLAVLAPLISGE